MSADNWAICPRCKKDSDADRKQAQLNAGKSYDKVSSDDYLAMLDALSKREPLKESMREDYQIGTDEDGVFSADYRCSCRHCGFSYLFKHSEQLKL